MHVVTDGSADLLPGTPEDVVRVPINLVVDDKSYPFPGCIDANEARETIAKSRPGIVKTTQPSPKQIVGALKDLKGDVLYITLSSGLSGTYNTARIAANILRTMGVNLHPFDSLSVSLGIGYLVKRALELADRGIEEVVKVLERERERIHIYFAVPSLDYLIAGGRIDRIRGILANLLGIRPILKISRGVVELEKKVMKTKLWEEIANMAPKEVYVGYGVNTTPLHALTDALREAGVKILGVFQINPIILAHAGPDVAGIMWIAEQ